MIEPSEFTNKIFCKNIIHNYDSHINCHIFIAIFVILEDDLRL